MSEEQNTPEEEVLEAAVADEINAHSGDDAMGELQSQLDEARAKADEFRDQALRAQAEVENVRRRAANDVESAHKFGLEKFARELLPVRDSLEMGLAAAEGGDEALAKLREGTELTLKMFASAMEKFGIVEVEAEGAPFNPEHHQAMSMVESADAEPNCVLMVMQKGYLLNERLLRPAMVVVAKAPAGGESGSIDEQA